MEAEVLHSQLPEGLPIPVDDGACDHLPGKPLSSVVLQSSSGRAVDLSAIQGTLVVYIYPISGSDNSVLPSDWDAIPGARGCTPQSCSFRDHQRELTALGATVFGLSTQTPEYLAGEVERIHLPFELLSDADLEFQKALDLPLLEVLVQGKPVLKRVTLICSDGVIDQVFYPVFPPDRSALKS